MWSLKGRGDSDGIARRLRRAGNRARVCCGGTAMIAILAGIVLLLGTARQMGPRVNRAMLAISAIVLAGFGVFDRGRASRPG